MSKAALLEQNGNPTSSAFEPVSMLPTKPCASCGRDITWRKKWERDWERVRYCSDACRRAGLGIGDEEAALEEAILSLLQGRSHGSSICPSEAARMVAGSSPRSGGVAGGVAGNEDEAWRRLMEPARRAARRLMARGLVEITQGGRAVDASRARGPIRIRLK